MKKNPLSGKYNFTSRHRCVYCSYLLTNIRGVISGILICESFLLFQAICKAVDYVTENDLYGFGGGVRAIR